MVVGREGAYGVGSVCVCVGCVCVWGGGAEGGGGLVGCVYMGWGTCYRGRRGRGYVYHQAEQRTRNKILLLTHKLRVHCPQVQRVERILLTKRTLIAAIPPKYTRCAALDYIGRGLL